MRTQLAYALTSDGRDDYARMAHISMSSVRRMHPQARIVVLCDEVTAEALSAGASKLLDGADSVVRVQTGLDTPMLRSRYLKTRMRELIDGDYLYMDADTIVVRRIDGIDVLGGDLCAVPDRHRGKPLATVPTYVAPHYKALGWTFPVRCYYNAGVVLWKDTVRSRALSRQWHERWRQCVARGLHVDQLAFNSAIEESDADVRRMPSCYNALVDALPVLMRGARIVHVFATATSKDGEAPSLLKSLLDGLAKSGSIEWGLVDEAVRTGLPWVGHPTFKQLLRAGRPGRALLRCVTAAG